MRYQQYLRRRYRTLLSYIGGIWFIVGLTMLSPLLLLPFYPQDAQYAFAFLVGGLPLIGIGVYLRWRTNLEEADGPTIQEGMVAIVIAWVVAILFGTIPFMLISDLNIAQAIFESTSGWTTTGLSVVDVEQAPHVVLFYRSALQLVGGAGFAIIVLSAIAGPTGSGIGAAEGRDDKLAPHVRESAGIVLSIYISYVVVGSFALAIAGMTPFDAVNHAFTALSTGGFSTRADSIGYYDSIPVEAVTVVLMLLGTLNYLVAYVLWRGKLRLALKNGEVRFLLVWLPVAIMLIFLGVTMTSYPDLSKQLRVAIFEATSAISTTGFSTVSYTTWPDFGWIILILAMLVGGGSGSTAGGIKQFRIYVLIVAVYWEIRRAFLPAHAVNQAIIWKGEQRTVLNDSQIRRIALFVFFFMVMYFGSVLIVTAHGYELRAAMFEMASTFGTVGLSVGITSADAPPTILWLQSFAMLLGRLEFFALIIGVVKLAGDSYMIFKPIDDEQPAA